MIVLAGPTVLSAVGVNPPHDRVRRRWRFNVAIACGVSQTAGQDRNRPRIVRAERLAFKLAHRRLSSLSARGIAHYHLIDGRHGRDARVSVRISFDNFSSSTRRASTIAPTMADQAAIAARLF